MNCCVSPSGMLGLCGLIAIETRAAGLTVKVKPGAIIPPEVKPMVVVPTPAEVASPSVPRELLMVATVASLDVQLPDLVRSWVVLSV